MKPVLEEALEQLKGPAKKPQPAPTAGLKDQLSPGKAFSDAMRQALGFDTGKPIPTPAEVDQMVTKDKQQSQGELTQIQETLAKEKQGSTLPPKSRGNLEAVQSSLKPPNQEPPEYIRGKPGYNPEKEAERKQKKEALPDLAQMSYKRPKGSWMQAIERKKHGMEVKGGRE